MILILLVIFAVPTLKSDIFATRRQLKSGIEPHPTMGIMQSTQDGVGDTPGTVSPTTSTACAEQRPHSEILTNQPVSMGSPVATGDIQRGWNDIIVIKRNFDTM